MEKYVPTKTSSTKHHQPWISNKLKRQSRHKCWAWRRKKKKKAKDGHDLRPSRKRSPERQIDRPTRNSWKTPLPETQPTTQANNFSITLATSHNKGGKRDPYGVVCRVPLCRLVRMQGVPLYRFVLDPLFDFCSVSVSLPVSLSVCLSVSLTHTHTLALLPTRHTCKLN